MVYSAIIFYVTVVTQDAYVEAFGNIITFFERILS